MVYCSELATQVIYHPQDDKQRNPSCPKQNEEIENFFEKEFLMEGGGGA